MPWNSFINNGRHGSTADAIDTSILCPSKRAKPAGSSTVHATKGRWKLITELYGRRYAEFTNAFLHDEDSFKPKAKWEQRYTTTSLVNARINRLGYERANNEESKDKERSNMEVVCGYDQFVDLRTKLEMLKCRRVDVKSRMLKQEHEG